MRRSRDAAGAVDGPAAIASTSRVAVAAPSVTTAKLSGFDLYNINGDAAAALVSLTDASAAGAAESETPPSFANQYNCLWLSQLVAQSSSSQTEEQSQEPAASSTTSLNTFLEQLTSLEEAVLNQPVNGVTSSGVLSTTGKKVTISQRRHQRNVWIMTYNRALALFVAGNTQASAALCAQELSPIIAQYSNSNSTSGSSSNSNTTGTSSSTGTTSSSSRKKSSSQVPASTVPTAAAPVNVVATSFDDVAFVASCRLAMLWLECILAWAVSKNSSSHLQALWKSLHELPVESPSASFDSTLGAPSLDSKRNDVTTAIPLVGLVLSWLEHVISNSRSTRDGSIKVVAANTSATDTTEQQLKFLLPIYKSRLALAEFDTDGLRVEACVRLARKDMKTAMEVFQNKLRPSFGGSLGASFASAAGQDVSSNGSVVSSGNNSEDGSSRQQPQALATSNSAGTDQSSSSTIHNVVLQKLNQSALSIKAHLEQLKGNTKKSLILCSEAAGATTRADDVTAYEPLHSNNLAVVYETNHRRFLALHALSKSLRAVQAERDGNKTKDDNGQPAAAAVTTATPSVSHLFHCDGTGRPDLTPSILYNTALCSLRARRYTAAYECLAMCIGQSPIFASRPTCWLRLAEACMGMFADLKRSNSSNQKEAAQPKLFSAVEQEGEPQGIVLHGALFHDPSGIVREALEANLGSPEDMEQVQRNPLLRACAALQRVVEYGRDDGASAETQLIELDALTSARLTLSYVYLALEDHRKALDMAKIVLEATTSVIAKDEVEGSTVNRVVRRLHRRQLANGRMYAAEACSVLGDLPTAIAYLVGDGKDDAFDRLASDLSGVSLEMAATNEAAKRKLALAQSMVSSSASAITAAMGNHRAAKQLAHAARSMEGDIFEANREQSSARRALMYTLLCEGSQSSALTMLLALH